MGSSPRPWGSVCNETLGKLAGMGSLTVPLRCVKCIIRITVLQDRQRMDFAELRLFLHLSRSLHFGRTSTECHISPSALSRAIQRLERDVGHALFARDNRSVELTPKGKRFQQ